MIKKVIVFLFVFILLITSYPQKKKEEDIKKEKIVENNESNKQSIDIKNVDIIYNDEVSNIDLEDYVLGVVACEMPASFDIEALKAMAVAARTFALYKVTTNSNYKLSTTTKDQCYISVDRMKDRWKGSFDKNYNKIKSAVKSTDNQYMTYNDKVIIAFYFSISNGFTENCENVFSQKLDYLKSVDSSWDKEYSYKEKTIKISVNEFLNKLGINSSKIDNIKIDRSDTNRIKTITINNKVFKGTKVRSLLGLRSTDFDIEINDDEVSITTRGYGHGVGLSQYGANAMAKKGYKYDEILKYYYTGIDIHE